MMLQGSPLKRFVVSLAITYLHYVIVFHFSCNIVCLSNLSEIYSLKIDTIFDLKLALLNLLKIYVFLKEMNWYHALLSILLSIELRQS